MVDALEQNVWHEAQQFDVQPHLGDPGAEMRRHLGIYQSYWMFQQLIPEKNSGIIILR